MSLANSFPDLALRLFDLAVSADPKGVDVQEWLRKVNGGISGEFGVPGVKAAMDLAGMKGGYPRRPLLPLTAQQRSELAAFLRREGVLAA